MHATLGALLVALGFGILAVALIEATAGFPFHLPRTWYLHRSLWLFFGVSMIVAGGLLQRPSPEHVRPWQAAAPGRRFTKLVVYTREGCHLCDDALDVLGRYIEYLPEIESVDIAASPELEKRFGLEIPVVEIDGQVRFKGHVSELLLQRLIDGATVV